MIHFDLPKIEKELNKLENETMQDGFWNDSKISGVVLQKIKSLKGKYNKFNNIKLELDNLVELNEFLMLELDDEMSKLLVKSTFALASNLEKFELETLLSGKFDKNNAIITLHPGARGNRITRLGRNAI